MARDTAEPVVLNGSTLYQTDYGSAATKMIVNETISEESNDNDDVLVLKTFRLLVADLCEQFNGGHPGGAMGMAAIGVALWKYVMQYAPHSPDFFDRDRFVLSNGHACLFQYCFLHLSGYKAMTLDQLKSYHSQRYDTLCPGHPEIEHEGIEVTTGPLGQGIANAVGLAAASKHLAASFNMPDHDLVSNHIWCMVGDACLQEGVALEAAQWLRLTDRKAISLAGHWGLGNLTVIYDNNQITCDGSVDLTNTEDINQKMRACGWNVVDIFDGSHDVHEIVRVLRASRSSDRPSFINVRTIIGLGSDRAGNAVAHGVALGAVDVARMKTVYGFDSDQHFVIPDRVRKYFSSKVQEGEAMRVRWEQVLASYLQRFPELGEKFLARLHGEMKPDWANLVPASFPEKPTASRASSGLVFNAIAEHVDSFMVGTADLTPSVNMAWKSKRIFQSPRKSTGDYTGRYIHYGIREHAMCAVANGLAAYQPNMVIPVTSSFFMFYLYAAPAVRMGALMHLQVIHAATHDSIGMGEDGPTHQPIELAALYRAMPNLLYIRPGDSEETAGAWQIAIQAKKTPSVISTSRHALPQLTGMTSRAKVAQGAYVLSENANADVTLIGVGAELNIAVQAATRLRESGYGVRIISFPCQRLFEQQTVEYRRSVLQRLSCRPIIAIEAYASNGWERYANAAICMSTSRFGQSLPGPKAYEYFGFELSNIVGKISTFVVQWKANPALRDEFTEFTEADGRTTSSSF